MTATLVMAALAGGAFGALYFGLLWQSVQSLTAKGGYRAFALAALARLVVVLAGLAVFFTTGGGLPTLAAAALGFIAARGVLTHRVSRNQAEG